MISVIDVMRDQDSGVACGDMLPEVTQLVNLCQPEDLAGFVCAMNACEMLALFMHNNF